MSNIEHNYETPRIAFFGGEPLAVPALTALAATGITPTLVICSPDRRAGRGLQVVAPSAKRWATEQSIPVYQPTDFTTAGSHPLLTSSPWDLFVVVAYNHILPQWLLDIPRRGAINLHPSLLPKLRGPSPIRTAILDDTKEAVGVSVMLLDTKMDHGPLLAQAAYEPETWPADGPSLDAALAATGATLLANTITPWLQGEITPIEQNHEAATYTKKFIKGANELSLDPFSLPSGAAAYKTLCQIRAWRGIGDTFFTYAGKRIKIIEASLSTAGCLEINRVIPEGKKEQPFSVYLQGLTSKK